MKTIYLSTLIGIMIGLVVADPGLSSKLIGSASGAIGGYMIGFIIAHLIIPGWVPRHNVTNEPVTLVSMRNVDYVSGAFIFGGGNFGQQTTYSFMVKLDDGSMMPHSVPANQLVRLIEDPSLENVGYWRTTVSNLDPSSALYPWSCARDSWEGELVRHEFRVPVGSVVQTFRVQ